MCSGPAGIGGDRRAMIEQLEPVLAASGLAAVYAASLAASRAQAGYIEPPAPLAAFLERRFLAGAPAMLQGMGQALRAEPDRVAELAAVDLPTLVLYGADDDAWPTGVQDDMARRLDAPTRVIAGAAHSPAVENPRGDRDGAGAVLGAVALGPLRTPRRRPVDQLLVAPRDRSCTPRSASCLFVPW